MRRLNCYNHKPRYNLNLHVAFHLYRHLNIGAGRVVWQDIVKIDVSIKKKQFHQNETILASIKRAKEGNGRLHFLGLVRPVLFPSASARAA